MSATNEDIYVLLCELIRQHRAQREQLDQIQAAIGELLDAHTQADVESACENLRNCNQQFGDCGKVENEPSSVHIPRGTRVIAKLRDGGECACVRHLHAHGAARR